MKFKIGDEVDLIPEKLNKTWEGDPYEYVSERVLTRYDKYIITRIYDNGNCNKMGLKIYLKGRYRNQDKWNTFYVYEPAIKLVSNFQTKVASNYEI